MPRPLPHVAVRRQATARRRDPRRRLRARRPRRRGAPAGRGRRRGLPQSPVLTSGRRPFSCAGTTHLSAGRIDEAARHAREALALTRRLGARASEAHALYLAGDVASAGDAEDAESSYREALALAQDLGMRPLVAHCHLGLGTLYIKTGRQEQARTELSTAMEMYRAMEMAFWLPQTEAALTQVEGR